MRVAKLGRLLCQAAAAAVLIVGMTAAMTPAAHAEWYQGRWGHWSWHHGLHVFVVDPYPYGYGYYPYGYSYAPPPPPPVYYAPPPPVVVGPSFGVFVGIH